MIGEKIGEGTGKVTGRRVVTEPNGGIKVEVSFESSGNVLGIELKDLGTYWSEMREGNTLYGEGSGIWMTKDGDMCRWHGVGVGRPTGKGMGANYRGSLFFETKSPRLSRLNGLCGVFEHDVDEDGNTRQQLWEWR